MIWNWIRVLAAVVGLALATAAVANGAVAGTAIFVFGKADVVGMDGSTRALDKGGALVEGERIVTGANGRVQIRMADGGLLALRPVTELVIERFRMGAEGSDPQVRSEPASFFELVKGGFRSITGAIGKQNKDAYRVRTPVATIGIRGTDYDALLCAADCLSFSRAIGEPVPDGLYVGVNGGAVRVINDNGFVDLDTNDFGYAGASGKAPAKSGMARQLLAPGTQSRVTEEAVEQAQARTSVVEETVAPDTGVTGESDEGEDVDFNTGETDGELPGTLAYANLPGAGAGVSTGEDSILFISSDGVLTGFDAQDTRYDIGSAQSVNVGRDEARTGATGLSWGRWSTGSVSATDSAGTQDLAVEGSIHWLATNAPAPQLPVTGSRSFALIGNTDPTDNNGNVGTLGSASLSANFDSQTVDADLSLSFAQINQVWDASARDVDINSSESTFAGAFDQVTINNGTSAVDGSGALFGFFSGDSNGGVNGAGIAYGLSDDAGVDVTGSAAFQVSPDGP